MNDHLPECLKNESTAHICICDRLRACEQRVENRFHFYTGPDVYASGYAAALDAAREAVEGTRPPDHDYPDSDRKCDCPYCCDVDRALAAIDGLREETK